MAVGWSIRQSAKFNSPPNFPANGILFMKNTTTSFLFTPRKALVFYFYRLALTSMPPDSFLPDRIMKYGHRAVPKLLCVVYKRHLLFRILIVSFFTSTADQHSTYKWRVKTRTSVSYNTKSSQNDKRTPLLPNYSLAN